MHNTINRCLCVLLIIVITATCFSGLAESEKKGGFFGAAGDFLDSALDGVGSVAGDVGEWASGAANDVGDWATGAANDVGDWASGAANDVGEWASDTASGVGEWATGAASDVGEWASGAVEDVGKWAFGTAEEPTQSSNENQELLESKYQQVVSLKENGDTEQAVKLLLEIGQYKDSMDLLRECFKKAHIQWSWLTQKIGSTVNAGKDTGYSKENPIDDKDPHLGWYLGRFWISGFTEERNESGRSTFIKTPGNNIILWFDLEQNIDALNNDENLSIARDINGYDQEFQIPKSDFGRGALFIRHINSQNEDTDPQEYKNYLVAHDDTGANAKVEIKEEGIYQVALDYEIAKKSKIAMANITDYYDYRISFSFEVRNGSGMFYLFDLTTESELQDYAVTNSGFRIDLANSHALSINFTRYGLNQTGTGLDVRKTALASNGDRFDKTGYYEITVTNRETNEKLTKHVFVGSDGDLEEYKEADPSILSKF